VQVSHTLQSWFTDCKLAASVVVPMAIGVKGYSNRLVVEMHGLRGGGVFIVD